MSSLTEDSIEQNLIALLQHQGYAYFNDSTIAPNSDNQREKGTLPFTLYRKDHLKV